MAADPRRCRRPLVILRLRLPPAPGTAAAVGRPLPCGIPEGERACVRGLRGVCGTAGVGRGGGGVLGSPMLGL